MQHRFRQTRRPQPIRRLVRKRLTPGFPPCLLKSPIIPFIARLVEKPSVRTIHENRRSRRKESTGPHINNNIIRAVQQAITNKRYIIRLSRNQSILVGIRAITAEPSSSRHVRQNNHRYQQHKRPYRRQCIFSDKPENLQKLSHDHTTYRSSASISEVFYQIMVRCGVGNR